MARRKKTWVESQNPVLGDDSSLMEYLLHAVWKNCRRLGWDMAYDWRSESFCRVDVWLPPQKGFASTRLYFDTATPGNLISFDGDPLHSTSETVAFVKSFMVELKCVLKEWIKKKGEAEAQRVFYLGPGKQKNPSAILADGKQSGEQPKQPAESGAASSSMTVDTLNVFMPGAQQVNQSGEVNLNSAGDTNVGGDAIGGDKATTEIETKQ